MRLIQDGDIRAVVDLMQSIGVHFAGSRSRRVLDAIARDAVYEPANVMIALAIDDSPVALVIAFRERAAYWRSFIRRHPLAALILAAHRARIQVSRRLRPGSLGSESRDEARFDEVRAQFSEHLVSSGAERWTDDSPDIAKVMYVAVHPQNRGSGIGAALYRWFFCELADRGVVRCDAQVSASNVQAAKLHRRFPFRVHAAPGGYFLWLMTGDVARK